MAGNTTKIDEVVDSAAVDKQLTDAKRATSELKKEFIDTLKAANDLNNAIGRASNTRDYNKSVQDAAIVTERLAQAQIRTQAAQERLAQATIRTQQAQDRQTASTQRLVGAYNQLQAEYNQLDAAAKNAGVEFGINSQQFKDAAKEALALRQRLSQIDETLGNFRRNVGNYRSGFQGLQNSINQMSRELPAFTFSAQTGFLALSNNIPIFVDEIGRARAEITRLRESGERVPGIFSQIAKSFLSWGTALSVGITLITIYGKEIGNFFSALFKGTKAMDEFAERQKTINSLWNESGKNSAAEVAKLNALFRAIENTNIPMKERIEAVNDLKNLYPEHLKNLTVDNSNTIELAKAYAKLKTEIIDTAYVQAAYNKISENTARIFEAEFKIINERGNNLKLRQQLNIAQKEENQLNKSGVRLRNANNDALNAGARGSAQLAAAQNALAASDKKIFDAAKDREISEQRNLAIQDQIENKVGRSGVGVLGGSKTKKDKKEKDTTAEDELTALEYQYNQQIELARAKDKENLELEKEYGKQLENYRKEVFARLRDEANMDYAQRILANEQAKNADLTALADEYEQGLIKTKEYNERKNDIEQGYAQESIKQQLQLAGDLIQVKKEQGEDTAKDEIELAKLQIRLSELVTAKKLSDLEKQKAKQAEINAAIKNLAEGAANFVIALVDAGFTNRKNQIAAEKDENDKRTQQEIDAVDRSLGTEQEKADKIAVIKAKQQSQNEAFARQQKKIDIEKAKFDKAVSIARIIENTAIGITSALAQFPPNVPLSILIGALGAIQLGTVLAQPIPQYAKGTKNAKGGLSIIGEEGAEKVDLPNGKSFISASTAQLINLPAGSKVTPHGETMRMIGRPDDLQRFTGGQQVPWERVIAAMEKKQPTTKNNINIRIDGSFEKYRQNHFK